MTILLVTLDFPTRIGALRWAAEASTKLAGEPVVFDGALLASSHVRDMIKCPKCLTHSTDRYDILYRFCPNCAKFHGEHFTTPTPAPKGRK